MINNVAASTVYAEGGGIDNDGTATISGTEVSGNTASYDGTTGDAATGGGVANDGSLRVNASRVTHMASDASGTGFDSLAEGAGVGSGPFSTLTVTGVVVIANTAGASNGLARGGGLGMRDARATGAPGGTALGGGIFGEGTTITVARSAATGNIATRAIA